MPLGARDHEDQCADRNGQEGQCDRVGIGEAASRGGDGIVASAFVLAAGGPCVGMDGDTLE